MQPGDTISITVPQRSFRNNPQDTQILLQVEDSFKITIDDIGFLVHKRRFYPQTGNGANGFLAGHTVIEKIGDLGFFLPIKDRECDAICPYELRCYQDSTIFYKAVDMPCNSVTPLESGNLPLINPDEVVLYPNPVHAGTKRIQVKGTQVKSWLLWDLQGRLIYKEERKFSDSSIDIPGNLQTGLYFLELRSEKARYIKQFIVR